MGVTNKRGVVGVGVPFEERSVGISCEGIGAGDAVVFTPFQFDHGRLQHVKVEKDDAVA